jgi:hypothetical protein
MSQADALPALSLVAQPAGDFTALKSETVE